MRFFKLIIVCLLLFISRSSEAGNFSYTSSLPLPDTSGFFKIQIPPIITSKLKYDYSDLRIFDVDNKEVPYILKCDNQIENINEFVGYEITDRKFFHDSLSTLIFKNNTGKNINEIVLVIRNADVRKELNLSGSFNGKQWFVVKNSENLSALSNSTSVSEVKLINFPLTNYTYYKIEFNDKNSAPLDIIKVGHYIVQKGQLTFNELVQVYTSSDSIKTKTTWIHITLNEPSYIDKIKFVIDSPVFYNRRANIYSDIVKKKFEGARIINEISLNSKEELEFLLPGTKTKELWIEILNQDNPPLRITQLKLFQYNHYVIAQLEKGKNYKLFFGDTLISIPQYDLHFFESVIPSSLPILVPVQITGTPTQITEPKTKVFFTDKRFIWAVLIVVLSLLGIVTYRMVNEKK